MVFPRFRKGNLAFTGWGPSAQTEKSVPRGLQGPDYCTGARWTQHRELRSATIAGSIRRAGIDSSAREDGPTKLERENLVRLRRGYPRLRMERDIISKAAA